MSQPTPYVPVHSFVSDSATLANFPGQALDVEFQDIKTTTDQIRTNLALVQRDDGALKNASVDWDQLTTAVKASIGDTTSASAILAAKTAAEAAAATATTQATASAGSATAAASSASAASTSATNAASSATAAATSASNAASTLASAVVGAAASTDGELMLFSGTTGKAAKRSSALTGVVSVTAGVVSVDAQLFSNIPQNAQSGDYTLVTSDAQKHLYHNALGAHTHTIPANASVAYPIGTTITFVNETGSGNLTIAITSDTLMQAGSGSTGSRTLAAAGMATALKITATKWIISGSGLT